MRLWLMRLMRLSVVVVVVVAALVGFRIASGYAIDAVADALPKYTAPEPIEATGTILRIDRKVVVHTPGLFVGTRSYTNTLFLLTDGQTFSTSAKNSETRLAKEGDEIYIKTDRYQQGVIAELINLTLKQRLEAPR